MPVGILSASWYTAETLAHDLEIPIEQAQELIQRAIASGRYPIAHHFDPCVPEISGYTVLELLGRIQPSASEQWQRQRQQAHDRIMQQAFEQYESEMGAILAQLDRQVARVSLTMLDVIEEALRDAETPEQKQTLVNRYSKQIPDLLSAAHQAIGVERVLERAQRTIEKEAVHHDL